MVLPWHRSVLHSLLEEGGGLPHALLFRGASGIGKVEFAQALAQALLCEAERKERLACGRCPACEWVAQRAHPDLRVLEPENPAEQDDGEQGERKRSSAQIGVDQVRSLGEFVNLSSHRGRAKVIVIQPAEAMNASAANALLKNLEEPPPATYFLLVSHRWHQLPATIKSRCRQLPMPLPDAGTARAWLAEQGTSNPELALAQAGGAPVFAARLSAEYWEQRGTFLGVIASPGFDPLRSAEQLRDLAPADIVKWLQQWSYDMVLQGTAGRVRYNPDYSDDVVRTGRRAGLHETLRFHRQMLGWQRVVNHPLNPRLFLEELLLSYGALVGPGRQGETG
ncbi:MAG TPA: DNA polymerase III subunit delta' [Burkholderiales bacterium]|nr:DNA polymerase III subunit delta' [Burkholderiales bacterium]